MRNFVERVRDPELPRCDAQALRLLAHVGEAIWLYDPHSHHIRWANPAALTFWKANSLEALRARDFRPSSQGTAERLESMRHSLINGGTVAESWTLYPGGTPRQVDCRFTGIHFDDGAFGLMIEGRMPAPNKDVGGAELRAIEAVRQSPLMISLMSPGGGWLMHNPAATALMAHLDLYNIPGMDNFLSLFADQDQAGQARNRAIEEGAAQMLLRMSGKAFRMHAITLRRLHDPVTGNLSLMLVQQDVTRSWRLEQRLKKALDRERTIVETQRHFLSLTSHEFRTPLSVIDGAARRIAKLLPDAGAEVSDRIIAIRTAVKRMNDAVNHTLTAAQIAEGKFHYTPVLADLVPIVRHAIAVQSALNPGHRIAAELPDLPTLMLDSGLVEQVLENLLTNAIKYSPEAREISVVARVGDHAVLISVADRGIGIPADDIPRLFTRFFRSRNARGFKGTGVGLHAVRYFMEMHGGKVSVCSKEGEGTTLTLSFPRPDQPQARS